VLLSGSKQAPRQPTGAVENPADAPAPPGEEQRWPWVWRAVVVVVCVGAFAGLTAVLYLASVHAVSANSDGATTVLEGQAMRSGNLRLTGWALSLDSFWTVDAVFYTVGVLLLGVRPVLLHLVPAVIAALVVCTGVFLARDGRRGAPGVAAGATVVGLLALPGHALAYFLLEGASHVATALWCLVAFAGLRRARWGLGWALAVIFLAAGVLGDFQVAAVGVLPAFLAGLVAMARTRRVRSGAPAVAASVASLLLAGAVHALVQLEGSFTIGKIQPRATGSQMLENLKSIPTDAARLLGVGRGPLGTGAMPSALQAVHVTGLIVVTAALLVAIAGLVAGIAKGPATPEHGAGAWRIDDLLLIACLGDLVVFVLLASSHDPNYERYLSAAVIFAAILAARLIGRIAATFGSTVLRRSAAALGVCVIASFAAGFASTLAAPQPAEPYAQLGTFLESQGLTSGLGDYWSSAITTVATNGSVSVRPVTTDPHGRVVRYGRQSAASWYRGRSFAFVVYDTAIPSGITSESATTTFGAPERTFLVGPYEVLVWARPLTVSVVGFDPG